VKRIMQANGNTHAVSFAFAGASHVSTLCGRVRSLRNAYLKAHGPVSCVKCKALMDAEDRRLQRQLSLLSPDGITVAFD
jgi:hypothetical protein